MGGPEELNETRSSLVSLYLYGKSNVGNGGHLAIAGLVFI